MGSNFRSYINSYVFETDLPGSGMSVSFKPVTTGQIKKLLLYETTEDPMAIETALDDMINECVVKPDGFNTHDLYIQDRFYLLVEIRKATRGATYQFQTMCTSCDSQSQQNINLSSLPVTKLTKKKKTIEIEAKELPIVKPTSKQKKGKLVSKIDEDDIEEKIVVLEETTKPTKTIDWDIVELNDNISVRMTLVTRELQKQAYDIFKSKHTDIAKIGDVEKTLEMTTILFALCIKGIITPEGEDTDVPLEEKIFLLDNIQQSEHEKISKWFEDNDFGIDFSFDAVCAHCGFKERRGVPVENFFY
jgi:uncharacterized protein (UPF0179 family)